MVIAVGYEDAKTRMTTVRRITPTGKSGHRLIFFGSRDVPDVPHAMLAQHEPGRVSSPHFHIKDQFQVVIDGKGRIGRHDLLPYSVHFSRAYTPYGPLACDATTGLRFFVLRARPDIGSQRLPKELEQLRQVPNRQPLQITRHVNFAALQFETTGPDTMLQPIAGMSDEDGLAAYTLSMKPYARVKAPDPSLGDGQYIVVVKGTLLHDDKELESPALVFVYSNESPFEMCAGSTGLDALVLNFPRPRLEVRAPDVVKDVQAATDFTVWRCALCEFVYDEAAGLPEEGIAPGTRWEDVPDGWCCPDCSASKSDFQMIRLRN
jgi:rubredoxin